MNWISIAKILGVILVVGLIGAGVYFYMIFKAVSQWH